MTLGNSVLRPLTMLAPVLLAASLASPSAHATVRSTEPASGLCKAASGPGAQVFYFDADYVQNTSSAVQYLTCTVPDIDGNSTGGTEPNEIFLHFENPTSAAMTFTCVIITRHGGDPSNAVVLTVDAPANATHVTTAAFSGFTPLVPSRNQNAYYAISCAIPAQGKMVSVETIWPGNLAP